MNAALSRRGRAGAGAQCGLCASAPRLRAGEETAGTELGATLPRPLQPVRKAPPLQPPARRPTASRTTPTAFPAHTPGTARPVPQSPRAEVASSRGRMGSDAASGSARPAEGEPLPHPAAPARRAPLCPGPGLTCPVAQLRWARPVRPDGCCRESCAGCAGGASPEPRPGREPSAARAAPASECARGLSASAASPGYRPPRAPPLPGTAPSPRAEGGAVGKETSLGKRSVRDTKATRGRSGARRVRPLPAAQGRPKAPADSAPRPPPLATPANRSDPKLAGPPAWFHVHVYSNNTVALGRGPAPLLLGSADPWWLGRPGGGWGRGTLPEPSSPGRPYGHHCGRQGRPRGQLGRGRGRWGCAERGAWGAGGQRLGRGGGASRVRWLGSCSRAQGGSPGGDRDMCLQVMR